MRLSTPSFLLGVLVAIPAFMVLSLNGGGFSLININAGVSDVPGMESENTWTPKIGWDAMFTGGAALLGLVVFGAALNALFTRNTEKPYGKLTIFILSWGVVFAAILSWALMYVACCWEVTWEILTFYMFWLLMSVLLVLFGYGKIIEEIVKRWKAAHNKDD